MLREDDVIYYKIKLQELFDKAVKNNIQIELGMKEVSFINNIGECASAIPLRENNY